HRHHDHHTRAGAGKAPAPRRTMSSEAVSEQQKSLLCCGITLRLRWRVVRTHLSVSMFAPLYVTEERLLGPPQGRGAPARVARPACLVCCLARTHAGALACNARKSAITAVWEATPLSLSWRSSSHRWSGGVQTSIRVLRLQFFSVGRAGRRG